MTQRDAVLATLKHEPVDFVPGFCFFATPQAEELLLPVVLPAVLPGGRADNQEKRAIDLSKALGNCMIDVHGNLRYRVVEEGDNYEIQEFENSTRRFINFRPEWFYENRYRPLDSSEDINELNLPDVNNPDRWIDQRRDVERFIGEGFFTRGTLNGFYSGVWYYCRKYENFVMDLAEGNDFVQELINKWGGFILESGRQLLECGVDSIYWTDDMGSNEGLLISPDMYRRYFFPWHKRAADLAHEYGKIAIMHSHGNINKILPDIIETGIDILDPVGPSDSMDIGAIKEAFGDRITLMGGISRFIGDMPKEELRDHLEEVYRTGCPGGGFIPMEEGGVPKNMSRENFKFYLQYRRELSSRHNIQS